MLNRIFSLLTENGNRNKKGNKIQGNTHEAWTWRGKEKVIERQRERARERDRKKEGGEREKVKEGKS